MRATEFIYEAETYQPPELAVGDKILKGKFKNSPAEIKGFTKDKHNQPVLKTNKGEVQLFKPRVAKLMKEDSAVTNMSAEDMIAYLRQHHDTNLHQDYLDHINTFSKFVLTDIPVNSIKTDLPKLDKAKVEQYKKMDFSKAPPIVMGGGYILDGYHRANVAKALGIPTIKGYVGVKDVAEDEPFRIKIGGAEAAAKAKAWIEKVYAKYPQTMQNNHVMTWGSGDDLQFAMFELTPSFSKRGAVEVKWFQAYPLRQGVGSRAMKELQALAREDGISLTLFPWDKGQVSQSKLTKFYKGQGFAPSVKGGKAMQWTPDLDESLRVDVPNEEWLENAIEYAKQKSPDRNGLPYMGKTTATARQVEVPLMLLRRIPGMRNEQQNVRQHDLAAIEKIMKDTGKLPLHAHSGEEYKPFINVAYDGSAWVNEGNHRIMAAYRLGWNSLPVEISYFDGGERVESGPMYPGKIGL